MQAMYYETYFIHLKYFLPPDISTSTYYPTSARKNYKKTFCSILAKETN